MIHKRLRAPELTLLMLSWYLNVVCLVLNARLHAKVDSRVCRDLPRK